MDTGVIRIYWLNGSLVLEPLTEAALDMLDKLEPALRTFDCVEPEEDTARLMKANDRPFERRFRR